MYTALIVRASRVKVKVWIFLLLFNHFGFDIAGDIEN